MPRKLLLADDSVTIQRVIELTFADEDIRVSSVGDGDAAIRLLQSDPPDIVLADIGMPGRDGYEVAQYVHDTPALKHVPVLLLTGAFDPVDEDRVRALGCAGVLVKPFEPQMLIARVRELLGSKPPAATAPAPSGGTEVAPSTRQGLAAGSAPAGGRDGSPAVTRAGEPAPAGAEPHSPADALLAAPSSTIPQERASTVDEYFARLDAAFATLDVPLDLPRSSHAPHPPAPRRGDTASPDQSAVGEATSDPQPTALPVTLADAFGALLGVEQGGPVPVFGDMWHPTVTDDLVDAVARRVTERLTEQIVRDLAPEIVSRVAEKIVREEIERLKALPR